VKKVPTVHFELTGTELPVRPQQEVVAEQSMISFIEHTPAYQTEVGHIFFLFSGIDAPPSGAGAKLPGNRSECRPSRGAIPESGETGPEYGPKNAVAWRSFRFVHHPCPVALAILARFISHPYRI
jgi:hypothetical protein